MVLQAGVAADAGAFGNQFHQFASGLLFDGLAGGNGCRCPLAVLFDGFHEFIGDANRQVAVLEHDAVIGFVRAEAFFD